MTTASPVQKERMVKKFRVIVGIAAFIASSFALSHWYVVRPIDNPTPVVEATVTDSFWACVDDAGTQVGARYPTETLAIEGCGADAADEGGSYFVESVDLSQSTTRTRTQEIRGSPQLRVSEADAQFLAVNGSSGTGAAAGQEGAPYDLYGTDSNERGTIPFTVTWPTAPQGTLTELTVNDASSLSTALGTANAQITVEAGSYGTLALAEDDQHWILADGAVFSGLSATGRPVRTIIEGGEFSLGTSSTLLVVDDFLMDNVNISAVGTFGFGSGTLVTNRVAMIQTTVVADVYALFTPGQSANDAGQIGHHLYVAGGRLHGGRSPSGAEATARIMAMHEFIMVDTWLENGIDTEATNRVLRSHYGNHNYWVRNVISPQGDGIYFQPRANGDPIEAINRMGDHWVYDVALYFDSDDGGATGTHALRNDVNSTDWYGELVAVNNTAYDFRGPSAEGTRWSWNSQTGDTVDDNFELAHEAPPALSSWLTANGIQPGADH